MRAEPGVAPWWLTRETRTSWPRSASAAGKWKKRPKGRVSRSLPWGNRLLTKSMRTHVSGPGKPEPNYLMMQAGAVNGLPALPGWGGPSIRTGSARYAGVMGTERRGS